MQTTVLIAHTLIAIGIIVLVLLQRGKGADTGAAFGAGASGTVFGSRGSTSFFSRTTAILATAFFATSLALAWLSSQTATGGPDSLIEDVMGDEPAEMQEPAAEDTVPSLPEAEEAAPEPIDASVPPLEPEAAEDPAPPDQ